MWSGGFEICQDFRIFVEMTGFDLFEANTGDLAFN